jgi:hypothetical protein
VQLLVTSWIWSNKVCIKQGTYSESWNFVESRKTTLYGCETWSLTLREEHRLRVFDNRVLRRIFGPKRDEVTGEWRKLHKAS